MLLERYFSSEGFAPDPVEPPSDWTPTPDPVAPPAGWTATPDEAEPTRDEWVAAALIDKTLQTAVLLVVVKLLAAWAVAWLRGVPISAHFAWRIVPYAGLETSGAEFRTVAYLSTTIVVGVALLWVLWHFVFRKHHHPVRAWAAATALPMGALFTFLEWWRRFDADHLIPTQWLVINLLAVAVATVLFVGFIEVPEWLKQRRAATEATANHNDAQRPVPVAAAQQISAQP